MVSAVAEDGARATLSENRYKTAGGGVVRDSEQSESNVASGVWRLLQRRWEAARRASMVAVGGQ